MAKRSLQARVVRVVVLVCVKVAVICAVSQTVPLVVAGQAGAVQGQTDAGSTIVRSERDKRQHEKAEKWAQDLHRPLVKVTLTTSRPDVTRDHAWGLTADIQNVGQVPIVLAADEILLVMQPEVRSDTGEGLPSFLASAGSELAIGDGGEAGPVGNGLGRHGSVALQPGDHALFFWNAQSGERTQKQSWAKDLADTLNFLPGPYTFNVVGRVHLANEAKVGAKETAAASGEAYRTFSEQITVKLGIGQLGLWLCAGLGAVLAYAMVALRERGDVERLQKAATHGERGRALGRLLLNAASAFLLGAVLSVVANRLSDTQFPVKVSVNDVWGAMTVGFVFFFVGGKFLDKLKGLIVTDEPALVDNHKAPGMHGTVPAHGV